MFIKWCFILFVEWGIKLICWHMCCVRWQMRGQYTLELACDGTKFIIIYFIPEVNRTCFQKDALQIYFIYFYYSDVYLKMSQGFTSMLWYILSFESLPNATWILTFNFLVYPPIYVHVSFHLLPVSKCFVFVCFFLFSMAQVQSGPQLSDKLCPGMGAPVLQSRESTVPCLSVRPHGSYWSVRKLKERKICAMELL